MNPENDACHDWNLLNSGIFRWTMWNFGGLYLIQFPGFATVWCGWKKWPQTYSPKWWWKMVIYYCTTGNKHQNNKSKNWKLIISIPRILGGLPHSNLSKIQVGSLFFWSPNFQSWVKRRMDLGNDLHGMIPSNCVPKRAFHFTSVVSKYPKVPKLFCGLSLPKIHGAAILVDIFFRPLGGWATHLKSIH